MLTAIVPGYNEVFQNKTIEDILAKAEGEVEVIAIIDGSMPKAVIREFWSTPIFINDPRVKYIVYPQRKGMRHGINDAVAMSHGDYIMKCDAHCMFEQGFDKKLMAECEDNWLVIPRRLRLDAEKWDIERPDKQPFDYCYLDSPFRKEQSMQNANWYERNRERKDILLDETLSFQGSMWFCKKSHFLNIGYLDTENYWGWEQEPQELGNKTWLSGGKVMVNKKVWYAHLRKGKTYGRMYHMDWDAVNAGHRYATKYWLENRWPKQIHKFEWLIDKFWPIPTWPENWKELKLEDYA